MNLLQETIDKLKEHNLTPNDVIWVGTEKFKTGWENFEEISNREYDSGYGGQEVATDILIVGSNWWLERHEYDGSEWWEFKKTPSEPKKTVKLTNVFGDSWKDLKELNKLK